MSPVRNVTYLSGRSHKTANATSRRFYACGGDKCPEQFGFRAEDADFARIDDLVATLTRAIGDDGNDHDLVGLER